MSSNRRVVDLWKCEGFQCTEVFLYDPGSACPECGRHGLIKPFSGWQQVETTGNYPEYTNAIGDAGYRYMQRCGGSISSGLFYWHELWDVLNHAASNSLEHVRQSPLGSVPAIGAPTAPAAPGSPVEPACQHDLLKPDTTIEVIDQWKARCRVCVEFFDLPGRPEKATQLRSPQGETSTVQVAEATSKSGVQQPRKPDESPAPPLCDCDTECVGPDARADRLCRAEEGQLKTNDECGIKGCTLSRGHSGFCNCEL